VGPRRVLRLPSSPFSPTVDLGEPPPSARSASRRYLAALLLHFTPAALRALDGPCDEEEHTLRRRPAASPTCIQHATRLVRIRFLALHGPWPPSGFPRELLLCPTDELGLRVACLVCSSYLRRILLIAIRIFLKYLLLVTCNPWFGSRSEYLQFTPSSRSQTGLCSSAGPSASDDPAPLLGSPPSVPSGSRRALYPPEARSPRIPALPQQVPGMAATGVRSRGRARAKQRLAQPAMEAWSIPHPLIVL
jgi:hypothetical protein